MSRVVRAPVSEPLAEWLRRQYRLSAAALPQSISAVHLVKERPGFGLSVRARPGSVIASPVLGAYDPDPDYFFHWYRDSAVVIDALRLLHLDGMAGDEALARFAEFLEFSLELAALDGGGLSDPGWREAVAPDFVRYLREPAELAAVRGAAVAAETRVNPDGTLDISKWARPQHDGPPLRALAVLRWLRELPLNADTRGQAAKLLRADLDFTRAHWREPSFDIWEEEQGEHYYTLRVAAAALAQGADWLEAEGEDAATAACRREAVAILRRLDGYWLQGEGCYRSRILPGLERSPKDLDIAVILSAIHAADRDGPHSVGDPRMQATLDRLEAFFDGAYAINRGRPAGSSPAMGRYAGDVYYSGGAYYFSTLGAAEFCFRAAPSSADADAWMRRGDGFLEMVRAYTPENGELSEQFDQNNGAQTSAKQLAWSHAALISCVAARRAAAEVRG
jgi:GH15 family glucan-1,4-alpha-glucosidase